MRGTLTASILSIQSLRIIPACAGNTSQSRTRNEQKWDHPRVCGEHIPYTTYGRTCQGSSPRVRGTQFLRFGASIVPGIIPACAGNTSLNTKCLRVGRDHPRVCGEHGYYREGGCIRGGIIPACAGNTLNLRHSALFKRDHPRVCGEHVRIRNLYDPPAGSSPRVRGTRPVRHHAMRKPGIIPACAGNTRG